ncbi:MULTISPECIES: glycoside hydrolase 43 family protein [unclassified Actinotalea]|uniref:glycoside hydrolase family 43 protein n=1 Tax=unclassified Actinotalea TaxID=2638618 RepID=UPI0015F57C3C|nr:MULTISPECIES: glycoside hydrolase 43 family protein [unclassified Actinotalea]
MSATDAALPAAPARRGASYRNPVLDLDLPDPDAVRVGEDYWMVASSFSRSPGLPVLHSRDLVRWEIVTHALPRLVPEQHFDLPRHGGGVWAPSIRHHDGVFHIVWPDPDRGIFVVSAEDPRGPWSEPRLLLAGLGLIDPCPFWDEDGSTWLVHGWAKSRSGVKNRLGLVPVDAGLTTATGPGRVVIDGDAIPGCTTLEGPKMYHHDGWYWIFAPAGGVANGWQSVFRSERVTGPYEHRVVMRQGETPVNGPHQGAWVDTPDGADWFLHFQDRGPFGRVVHLQPMTWGDDGWPIIGTPTGEGYGTPVITHPTPHGTTQGSRVLPGSDDFTDGLGRQWFWQANPGDGWARTRDGRLELRGPGNDDGNVRSLPQVLAQQLPGTGGRWTCTLTLDGPDGARAGVTVLGRSYLWCGLREAAGGQRLVAAVRENGDQDETLLVDEPAPAREVELRVDVDPEAFVRLSARTAEGTWRVLGSGLPAQAGHWVGAEIGVFAAAPLGSPAPAVATVGPVRLEVPDAT